MWREDDWFGSHYELAIEVTLVRDDVRLQCAADALLRSRLIGGLWRDRLTMAGRVKPLVTGPDRPLGYSILDVGGLGELGSRLMVVRETGGSDWLVFCVPTGMVELVAPVTYPLSGAANAWTNVLDDAFTEIAELVYSRVAFDLAIIGEEVSGTASAASAVLSDMRGSVYLLSPGLSERVGAEQFVKALPCGLRRLGPLPYQHQRAPSPTTWKVVRGYADRRGPGQRSAAGGGGVPDLARERPAAPRGIVADREGAKGRLVVFRCSVCNGQAATVELLPRGASGEHVGYLKAALDRSVDRLVVDTFSFIHGAFAVAIDRRVDCRTALDAEDAGLLYAVDPRWAAFYCRECAQAYCEDHWRTELRLDGVFGSCPAGHSRRID